LSAKRNPPSCDNSALFQATMIEDFWCVLWKN